MGLRLAISVKFSLNTCLGLRYRILATYSIIRTRTTLEHSHVVHLHMYLILRRRSLSFRGWNLLASRWTNKPCAPCDPKKERQCWKHQIWKWFLQSGKNAQKLLCFTHWLVVHAWWLDIFRWKLQWTMLVNLLQRLGSFRAAGMPMGSYGTWLPNWWKWNIVPT